MPEFRAEVGDDAQEVPTRLLVVQGEARPPVTMEDEDMAMAFPHLIVRESICFLATFLVLSILALCFEAPLEGIANPEMTPNPAKAPWYFLGLQELLHYYPPLISGIILPGLIVVGLIVIPYFDVNLKRTPMWRSNPGGKFLGVWAAALGITALLELTSPYLHDGSRETLEETVKIMGTYQLGKELSDAQVNSIVTFLKSLTGDLPAHAKPQG